MKSLHVIFVLLLAPLLSWCEIVVCHDCDVSSIEQAIEMANHGDEIFIKKGHYKVNGIVIDKRLTVRGEEGTLLDGEGLGILFVHHNGVVLRDLEFQNVETNYVEDRAAVKCNDSDSLFLDNLKVRHSFFGIMVEKSNFGTISNCEVVGDANEQNYLESSNGNAIHLWYCKDMIIEDNVLMNHRDGIYFEFVDRSQIRRNHSDQNMRYGLHFMFSHHNTYLENTFIHNGAGVAVMYSSNVIMESNRFVENWGGSSYGLLLKDITDSELKANLFENNTIAISADNTSRMKINGNVFRRNGYAMRVMGNCNDNVITSNDFVQNSFDITTNARSNYNDFSGNHWEEYNGYDLDRDGIGDVPFRPVKLFTYIVSQAPASIILMRSTFIDLLNLAEKVTPVLTPESLIDEQPRMKPINDLSRLSK